MAGTILDILWRSMAWGVVALGAAVILVALLGDWVRGVSQRRSGPRLRCPGGWSRVLWIIPIRQGCWYDMSAAEPDADGRRQCPECGRTSSLRRLKRSRRRYRLAAVGLFVASLGLGARYASELYRRGWSAVPDAALVLVPFDERKFLETGTTGGHWLVEGAAKEIAARDGRNELSDWSAGYLGRRVRARYMRDPDYGVDDASRATFAKLESTPFTQGIDAQPFIEAVRTIAAAAGVEIEIEEEVLRASAIDPTARVTVPKFGLMTCEQALDWACDRTRGRTGWAVAEWDVRGETLVISTSDANRNEHRVQVLLDARCYNSKPSLAIEFAMHNSDTLGRASAIGDAAIVSSSRRGLIRADRTLAIMRAGGGAPSSLESMADLETRLSAELPMPEPDDTLASLLHGLSASLQSPIEVDPWGVPMYAEFEETEDYEQLKGATAADASAYAARNVMITRRSVLDAFGADLVHDGRTAVVGLRARSLLATVVAYQLPEVSPRPFTLHPPPASEDMAFAAWDERVWRLRVHASEAVRTPPWDARFFFRIEATEDRIVVVAPPDLQAIAAPIINRHLAEWQAELDAAQPDR